MNKDAPGDGRLKGLNLFHSRTGGLEGGVNPHFVQPLMPDVDSKKD